MAKNFKVLRILVNSFGFKFKYLILISLRMVVNFISTITLALDHIFYPGFKLKKIKEPVFLIGHPRSGTTFLHRFIAKSCPELRTLYLWELALPALTARKLVTPFKEKIREISLDKIWKPKIHKTNFFEPETEDVALFFRFFDGFLAFLYFYIWDDYLTDDAMEKRLIEVCNNDKYVYFMKSVHQKNLYKNDLKMFSKSFALVFNVDTILKAYPDVKILLMIRDPKQSIPSFMSLLTNAQNTINGLDKASDEKKKQFYGRVYKASLTYHKIVHKLMQGKLRTGRILLITHKQLLSDFKNVFMSVIDFYNINDNNTLKKMIKEQEDKQANFKSEHVYNLSDYGIEEKQIEADFKFIYDNYPV